MNFMPRWFRDYMKVYRTFKELKVQEGEILYLRCCKDWDQYHDCNAIVRVNKIWEDESVNVTDLYGGDVYSTSAGYAIGKRPTWWERFRYYIWWHTS